MENNILLNMLNKGIKILNETDFENIKHNATIQNVCARLAHHLENLMQENDNSQTQKMFKNNYAEVMFCTKCGNQIKDGYKFCSKCGTPVYVEQGGLKSDVINDVDEVIKEGKTESMDEVVSTIDINEVSNTEEENKSKKKETDSDNVFIPNPLIAEELDIVGVKKKAEQGDKEAMLRQAFRYEMGIGVEKDTKKAEDLYNKAGGKESIITSSASTYVFKVELMYNLYKTSE